MRFSKGFGLSLANEGKVNEGAVRMWRKDPGERSNSSLPSRSASLQEQRYAGVYAKSRYYIENPALQTVGRGRNPVRAEREDEDNRGEWIGVRT